MRYIPGMFINYLMNIGFIAILLMFLLVSKNPNKVNIGRGWYMIVCAIILSTCGILVSQGYFTALLVLKVIMIAYVITHFQVKESQMVNFLNRTYLLYVLLSIIFFVFFPSVLYELKTGINNTINVFGFTLTMLHSLEGSAASLDTYTCLILVMNLSLKETVKRRKFYVLLSLTVLFWSFRLTPILALGIALMGSYIVRTGKSSVSFVLLALFVPFLASIVFYNSGQNISGVPLDFILNGLTHNRAMIWNQQLDILWSNYSIKDYIFGNFSSELFSVQSFQIHGGMRKDYFIDNPHNSYLYLFFRSPLLFAMAVIFCFIRFWKRFDLKWWPVIIVILTGALTNGQLLTLQNPVPLIVLIFYLCGRTKSDFHYAK